MPFASRGAHPASCLFRFSTLAALKQKQEFFLKNLLLLPLGRLEHFLETRRESHDHRCSRENPGKIFNTDDIMIVASETQQRNKLLLLKIFCLEELAARQAFNQPFSNSTLPMRVSTKLFHTPDCFILQIRETLPTQLKEANKNFQTWFSIFLVLRFHSNFSDANFATCA